jgi:hypothetical protein
MYMAHFAPLEYVLVFNLRKGKQKAKYKKEKKNIQAKLLHDNTGSDNEFYVYKFMNISQIPQRGTRHNMTD